MAKIYKVLSKHGDFIREYSDEKVAKGFASKVNGRTVVEGKDGKKEVVASKVIAEEIIEVEVEIELTAEEVRKEKIRLARVENMRKVSRARVKKNKK